MQYYEEVIIPPAKPVPPRETERLISVSELDPLAKGSFLASVLSFSNMMRVDIRVHVRDTLLSIEYNRLYTRLHIGRTKIC